MKEVFQRGSNCPQVDELLSSPQKPDIREHLKACPACQTELALFGAFQEAALRPEEAADLDHVLSRLRNPASSADAQIPAPQSIWDRLHEWWSQTSRPVWLGGAAVAAASLLVVVSLGTQMLMRNPSTPLPASDRNTWRGADLSFLTKLGDLEELPREIRWTPVPAAAAYAVSLTEIDGARVFYKKFTTPLLETEPDIGTLVRSGKVYLLTVVALSSDGRHLGEAGPARIRLVRAPSSQK